MAFSYKIDYSIIVSNMRGGIYVLRSAQKVLISKPLFIISLISAELASLRQVLEMS